jgi:hypothetical protein
MRFAAFLAVTSAFLSASSVLAAGPDEDLKQKFQQTILASRHVVEVQGNSLKGAGGILLQQRAASADFVLIGEEHGVATIADTVRFYFSDIAPLGYRHFAIEADPYMAERLETQLRAGGLKGLARFLAPEEARLSMPFYSWAAEAQLAESVVRRSAGSEPVLWGLDQVFIGAVGLLLRDVAQQSKLQDAKSIARGLADQAKGDLEFLGKVDLKQLETLKGLLSAGGEASLAQLIDDMIVSAGIYAPFVGREGVSVYQANLQREQLMKSTFMNRYVKNGRPKVVFKFGANHLTRGLSPVNVPSLSSFVHEFALTEGKRVFSLLILCGPGTKAGGFQGEISNCDMDVTKEIPEIASHLDPMQPTLFDLAGWKDRPKRWEHLSEAMRRLLWGYDAVMIIPNGKPAQALK